MAGSLPTLSQSSFLQQETTSKEMSFDSTKTKAKPTSHLPEFVFGTSNNAPLVVAPSSPKDASCEVEESGLDCAQVKQEGLQCAGTDGRSYELGKCQCALCKETK